MDRTLSEKWARGREFWRAAPALVLLLCGLIFFPGSAQAGREDAILIKSVEIRPSPLSVKIGMTRNAGYEVIRISDTQLMVAFSHARKADEFRFMGQGPGLPHVAVENFGGEVVALVVKSRKPFEQIESGYENPGGRIFSIALENSGTPPREDPPAPAKKEIKKDAAPQEKSPGPVASSALEKGKALYQKGEMTKAHALFLKAFDTHPQDREVSFYLGRTAFETGDYETAVMAFERLLIWAPKDRRAQLELARTYFNLGLYDMARRYFNEVLTTSPPGAVAANIQQFLQAMDRSEQTHFFSGHISMGVNWTDNAFAAPNDRIIQSEIGDIILTDPSAEKQSDWSLTSFLGLNHAYRFPDTRHLWRTSALAYQGRYADNNELNTRYFRGETGPQALFGRQAIGFQVMGSLLHQNREKYLDTIGFRTYWNYLFKPSLSFHGELGYEIRDYGDQPQRNGDRLSIFLGSRFRFKDMLADIRLGFETQDANEISYGFHRYTAKFYLEKAFIPGLSGFAGYEYQQAPYRARSALFEKREDEIHYLTAGVRKSLWQSPDGTRRMGLILNCQHTDASSSLDLYDYKKNMMEISLEYDF